MHKSSKLSRFPLLWVTVNTVGMSDLAYYIKKWVGGKASQENAKIWCFEEKVAATATRLRTCTLNGTEMKTSICL